jgi:hypothetical protein
MYLYSYAEAAEELIKSFMVDVDWVYRVSIEVICSTDLI